MVIRHHGIKRPPEAVWAVLENPELYGEGGVGGGGYICIAAAR
ncbi:hypothetical protein ABT040_23770 [Streptomyces sp. NPDC002688]